MTPTIRMLNLGDSYTIGESVAEAERWPNQLAAGLAEQGITTEVKIIAKTGWTTDELWAAIQAQKIDPPYDIVTLLIGVNNQYRGRSTEEYRAEFAFLLNKAIEYAGQDASRVIVLSIPDWGVTPFALQRSLLPQTIAAEIDAYNLINQQETQKVGAHYVDITPISRQNDESLIAADGLHPSAEMYNQWVKLVLPIAIQIAKPK